jgi:hypothetical protein
VTYLVDTDWVIDFLIGRADAGRLLSQILPAGAAIDLHPENWSSENEEAHVGDLHAG